jgi:YaaC-like Protein
MATKKPVAFRKGEPLKVGRETVTYGRNILLPGDAGLQIQHRLFVNDPWELIAEAIARAISPSRNRDIAQSFRRQAEDYFRAATTGRELAVRPVLLYYAFLNLSKAYGVAKGNTSLAGTALHGLSAVAQSEAKKIHQSVLKFSSSTGKPTFVFQQLLNSLGGNPLILKSPMKLGHLMPQILPGHRLWCYATAHSERFLTVEHVEVLHDAGRKDVWLNLYLRKSDLERLEISEARLLSQANLQEFDLPSDYSSTDFTCVQQRAPEVYSTDPADALAQVVTKTRNKIWETVKTASPYRKSYIYCTPPAEHGQRLPQMLSLPSNVLPGLCDPLLSRRFREL